MFGNFLQRVKNLVTGDGWQTDEEERRKRQQTQVVRPTQAPQQSTIQVAPQPQQQQQQLSVVDSPQQAFTQRNQTAPVFDLLQKAPEQPKPEAQQSKFTPEEIEARKARSRAFVEQAKREEARRNQPKTGNALTRATTSFLAGLGRFGGAGTAQLVGGAVDLLTPGKGTNRLSDWGNRKARELDVIARDHGNEAIYRGTQIANELLSLGATGGVTGLVKGVSKARQLGDAVRRGDRLIKGVGRGLEAWDNRVVPAIGNTGREAFERLHMPTFGRLWKKGADLGSTSTDLVQDAAFTAKEVAQDTSRGTEITPKRVGSDVLLAAGLNPIFSGVSSEVVQPLVKAFGAGTAAEGVGRLRKATNIHGEPSKISVASAPDNVPGPIPGELEKGVASANPAYDNIDMLTPAYQRRAPQTIGEAQFQHGRGISNLSDEVFDADARLAPVEPEAPTNLDIPAFIRRNPEAILNDANERLVRADQMIGNLEGAPTPDGALQTQLFDRRQQGVETPTELRQRLAKRNEALVPAREEALKKAIVDKNEAAREGRMAIEVMPQDPAVTTPPEAIPTPPPTAVDATQAPVAARTAMDVDPSPETAPIAPEGAEVTAPVEAIEVPEPVQQASLRSVAPGGDARTAKTGEIGKSQSKIARGREYEKTSVAAAKERGAKEAANTSYEKFIAEVAQKDLPSYKDRDIAISLQDRYAPGSAEHRRLGEIAGDPLTEAAQVLGSTDKTIRRTATPKQLTDRFANRLYSKIDDDITLSESDFEGIIKKNQAFTDARAEFDAALERFNTDPSDANMKNLFDAFEAVEIADRAAKFEEYDVASRVTKGSKNPETIKLIKELERESDIYTMDWVDSSMLSSTRVMLNNFINTMTGRAEEQVFGKVGAALARKLTGANIGGGSIKGARLGAEMGQRHWKANMKLRKDAHGNKLVKAIKNFTTSGNTIGDRNTYASAYSAVFDHYRAQLKKAGYNGEELNRRALVNSLVDPDRVAHDYMNQALANNAMSSMTAGAKRVKIETWLTDSIAAKTGNNAFAKGVAKAITRVTLGFPTVIARSAEQGGRRSLLGGASLVQAAWNAARKGAPEETARHIKNSVKEFGSGATMFSIGYILGGQGLITGAYPTDKDAQEAWKREGKTDNAIKIGSQYYSLPSALGVFALPFMLGANAADKHRQGESGMDGVFQSSWRTVMSAMPHESLMDFLKFVDDMERGKDVTKYATRAASSLVRGATPLGSLVNQVAKMFDPNANDTTKGDAMAQFLAKVQDGIPGLANQLDDKTIDGNTVENTNPIARVFGATSKEQSAGVAKSEEVAKQIDDSVRALADNGVFTDAIRNIIDDDKKGIFDNARAGKKIDESDLKDLVSSITKNVNSSADTRFLEDGDYDSNLAVLKAKRDSLKADPTVSRARIEKYETQIRRGEVYKQLKTSYETLQQYRKYNLTEWRNLGDPYHKDYKPKLYQKLWELDQALLAKKATLKDGDPESPKYYAKGSKSGGGGGSGRGGGRGGGANAALRRVQSNTIGSPISLSKVDFGRLQGQSVGSTKIPTINKIKPSDLIKKRKISVSRG